MPEYTYKEILNNLKKKIYSPVYLLSGEESYFIDKISDFIEENVLTEEEKAFNLSILYGNETDVNSITAIARRFPMASSHNVVIVKEAQSLKKIEDLKSYFDDPLESTLLVINYKHKKLDKRKGFVKTAKQKWVFFESPHIYENKIPGWIKEYLAEKQYTISPKAAFLLVEYLGTDLEKIANELDKLIINLKEGEEITDKLIEEYIGISKDYNVFELQNALGQKDVIKANRIINYFAANPKEAPLVRNVFLLYLYFSKLLIYKQLKDKSARNVASSLKIHPFFVKDYVQAANRYSSGKLIDIISLLREYDLKAKGVNNLNAPEGELYKELIFKILH